MRIRSFLFAALLMAGVTMSSWAQPADQAPPPPPAAPVADPAPAAPVAPTPPPPAEPAAAILNVLTDGGTNVVVVTNDIRREPQHRHEYRGRPVVKVGADLELKAGETNYGMVVVGGNAVINGTVLGELVVVGGNATVNGKVSRDLVVVMGNLKLGPDAKVRRQAVVVGGKMERASGSEIGEEPFELNPTNIPGMTFAVGWISKGLLWARPLPHQLAWAWVIAGLFLLINVLLAVMFPRPVQACVEGVESRPLSSFFTGVLVLVLFAPLLALLAASVVGILVIPFLLCAGVVSLLLGKVVVYQYVGRQFGRQLNWSMLQLPLAALVIGTVTFYLLYTIPIIGLLAWAVITIFGLGAVVLTATSSLRRENERPNGNSTAAAAAAATLIDPVTGLAATNDASTYPRAGFWIRLAAVLLDAIIFCVLTALIRNPPIGLLAWCGYHVAMWTWKGTTLGGIVTGIKIVRLDGSPIDLTVAIVRFLAGFLSLVVLLIGFFWAGWSRQKRSWHDIIAGTIMVKAPKGLSLV